MEIPSTSQTEKAILGEGYNFKEERFAGECVMGTPVYAGAPEAAIQFDRSLSSTEMADSLGFSIGAKARYGLISGSLSAKFASESSASDFSEVSVYSANYKFKNAKLNYTGLTPVGQQAKGSSSESNHVWENWERTCGHEYVSEIVLGASLYLSIKVEFATSADKSAFNAEFNIKGPMFGASGSLSKASETFGSRGFITIRAYQLGGDVSKLSQALSAETNVDGQHVSALISCSMEDPKACLAALDRAIDYATHEFPEQIKPDYNPGNPVGPAELLYITRPWEELALYPPPPLIAEGVRVARQDLSFQFEQNLKYRNRVRALKTGKLRLSPRQQIRIDQIDEEVSRNFNLINEAAIVCYNQMDKCVAKVDEVKGKLHAFNDQDFEVYPETFAQWYSIKDLPGTSKAIKQTIDSLEAIVRGKVNNFDKVQDKAKTAENLLMGLTEINLSIRNITDLKLLSLLTNLQKLYLGQNQITDISPLVSLKNLQALGLSRNQIANLLPLAALTNLTALDLDNNQISDVSSLSVLSNLTNLGLKGNRIKDIAPLSSLKNLATLSFGGNPIENIKSLSSLPLANLFVTADQISVIEGAGQQYEGIWTRRNQSNIFDAYWRNIKTGTEYRNVMELTVLGNQQVTLYCPGYGGRTYSGTLSPDHQQVIKGTADYKEAGYQWKATIKSL